MKNLMTEIFTIVFASMIMLTMAAGYVAYTKSKVLIAITMQPAEEE